jgi:predicted permease
MGIFKKIRNGFRPLHADADDEITYHVEQRTADNLRAGMSPEEALRDARRRFGNRTLAGERTAEADVVLWLEALKRDIRLAARMLRRTPGVTTIAILSLALGIGANTVVFTLMKQVVLDSLPVPDAKRLVILHNTEPELGHESSNGMRSSFSYPLYRDLQSHTKNIFDDILARYPITVSLATAEQTQRIHGELVSGNYFQVLGVRPWRGRVFTSSDDGKPGAHPVVVLGYGFWKQQFGGNPAILNQKILLNRSPYLVIGIAAPAFYGIDISQRADVFVPMAMKAQMTPGWDGLNNRVNHWANLIAKLRPGITPEKAAAALSVIYPPLRDQDLAFMHPGSRASEEQFKRKTIGLTPGGRGYTELRQDLGNPLRVLMVMVGLVLVITAVNLANLLIARGVARQREMAIRLSVGAGRRVLIRQLLVESLMLALAGGAFGFALAFTGAPLLLRALKMNLSGSSLMAHPDWQVFAFAAIVSIVTGLAFGLLPALQSTRAELASVLKTESGASQAGHSIWLRRVLVIGQIALSLVLVVASILFTFSLRNLMNINPGFQTDHLITFGINPAEAGYSQQRISQLGEQIRTALDATPGVASASVATVPVLEGNYVGGGVTIEGHPMRDGEDNEVRRNGVGANYFATMHIPILQGRGISAREIAGAPKVVVVNENFCRRFLAGQNPLGLHIAIGSNQKKLDWTIVGVVADSHHGALRDTIFPFMYHPYLMDRGLTALTFYARTKTSEAAVMDHVRGLVRRFDPTLPVYNVSSMTEVINESLFAERSLGLLSLAFGILATLLSIVGLYGVMSYSVARRYREIGIRMALGARPRLVMRMVLSESALLGLAGVACALPVVFAAGGLIRSELYGIAPNNPWVWLASAILLLAVTLFAGFLPALSAARIDPQTALRSE